MRKGESMGRAVIQESGVSEFERASVSPEEKRECPECGQPYTVRGLHGHLRLAHRLSPKQILKVVQTAKGDRLSEAEEIFGLLDRLYQNVERVGLLFRLRDTQCLDEDLFGRIDEALDKEHNLLKSELNRKGVSITNEYLNGLELGVHWDNAGVEADKDDGEGAEGEGNDDDEVGPEEISRQIQALEVRLKKLEERP
jgi:hypothetical protein